MTHRVCCVLLLRAPLPPPRGLLLPVELKAALAYVLSSSIYIIQSCRDFELMLKICRNKIYHPFHSTPRLLPIPSMNFSLPAQDMQCHFIFCVCLLLWIWPFLWGDFGYNHHNALGHLRNLQMCLKFVKGQRFQKRKSPSGEGQI